MEEAQSKRMVPAATAMTLARVRPMRAFMPGKAPSERRAAFVPAGFAPAELEPTPEEAELPATTFTPVVLCVEPVAALVLLTPLDVRWLVKPEDEAVLETVT